MSAENPFPRTLKDLGCMVGVMSISIVIGYGCFQLIKPVLDMAFDEMTNYLLPDQHKPIVRFYRPADFSEEHKQMAVALSTAESNSSK